MVRKGRARLEDGALSLFSPHIFQFSMSQELRTMTIKKLVLWGLALEEKREKEREIEAN